MNELTTNLAEELAPEKVNVWGTTKDLQLLFLDDPFLSRRPSDFDFKTEKDTAEDLASLLVAKMLELKGVGLSANQVGIDRRVFVFGTSVKDAVAMFNPEILSASKEKVLMDEGCLSFPDLRLALLRPKEIVISYQDVNGETIVARFGDLGARIIQHEFDHMEGYNFTMLASPFKIKHELNKLRKKHQRTQKLIKRAVADGRIKLTPQ